ncbi:MAG TPA: C39 family peptidase [bacterium]|nr:C39 family peptidase [bacterium]
MKRIKQAMFTILVVAGIVLAGSMTSAGTPGGPATPAQLAELATAQQALDRALTLGSDEIIPKAALRGAVIDAVIEVHDPQTLTAVYGVAPIRSAEGKFLGLIGVAPEGSRWLWYNFHCPFDKFPPVSADEAGQRLNAARGAAAPGAMPEQPILIAGCDKHLYWRYEPTAGESWLIDAVLGAAPVLNSLDQSATKALTPDGTLPLEDQSGRPQPSGGSPSPGNLGDLGLEPAPAALPACYNIPGIPYHFQITDWFCGPASLQMIMDYYGQEIGQQNIADVANDVVNSGTMATDMRRAAHFSGMSYCIQDSTLKGYKERKLGYACIDASFMTGQASKLKNAVYAQYPVFVLTWFDASHSAGHYRVVKGYDDNLNVFIVHDPWYAGALCGPDLLVNQDFFITDLWAYSGFWCMVASPWILSPSVPATAAVGETVSVGLKVHYPGPARFKGLYPVTNCQATISLPAGLALASGTPTVALPNMVSDDSATVTWSVVVLGPVGDWGLAFQAQALVQSSSYSYPSYSDTIGGQAYDLITAGSEVASGWGAEERLTNDAGSSATCFPGSRAMVAEDDGTIDLVWADTRDGNSEIYYDRRASGTWQAAVRLTNDPAFSDAACIARGPDGSLHVAWVDQRDGNQEIYYKRWDQASGWSADERVTTYSEVDRCPTIAVGDSLVYLAWERRLGGSYRVAAVEFATRGSAGWSSPVDVDGSPTRDSYHPSLTIGPGGLLHLVYERQTSNTANEHEKVMYKSWNGAAWSASVGLSSGVSFGRSPAIAVTSDSKIHVVWQDGEDLNGDIFYAWYDGTSWQPTQQIVAGGTEASTPSIATDPTGNVDVAWVDNRNGESEIYMKTKSGGTWGSETRLSQASGASVLPTVAADHLGGLYVVWTDFRDGNADLYFRANQGQASVPSGPVGPVAGGLVRLSNPSPMPFAAEVRLALTLEQASQVSVEVFDVRGQLIRTLAGGRRAPGTYELAWDGCTSSGTKAASGLYFVALRSPLGKDVKSVVLVR